MYTLVALKDRILGMFPEMEEAGLSVGLRHDEDKDAFVVSLKKGPAELQTYLARRDADACMNGERCVSLGLQVAEFIKNLAERERFGGRAA